MRLDIECLLCGRFLARATGHAHPGRSSPAADFQAQPSPSIRSTIVSGTELARMRCTTCGGPGVVVAIDRFATYAEEGRPLFRKRPTPGPATA